MNDYYYTYLLLKDYEKTEKNYRELLNFIATRIILKIVYFLINSDSILLARNLTDKKQYILKKLHLQEDN